MIKKAKRRKRGGMALTRDRVAKVDRRVSATPLYIKGLTSQERERLRERVWYSGAGPDYIATAANVMALAVHEFMRMRRRKSVTVRFSNGCYSIC